MRAYCTMLLFVASLSCWAQPDSSKINQLSVGMNFMTHGETCGGGLPRAGDSKPIEDRSHFLMGRLRLNVDYERPGLQIHAIIQKVTAKNGLFAQLGRIALSYDDERAIGPNDFSIAAKSHDALRVGYEGYGHKLHAILAYNQTSDQVYSSTYYDGGAQPYKTMQTVWYHYDVPKFPLGASLLFMNMGMQAGINDTKASEYKNNPPSTVYQQLYGGYINFHPKHLTLEGSYYRQGGKMVFPNKKYMPIKASMASVKATVTPTDKYGFTLGYDYLSGDDYVPVAYGGPLVMVRHDEIGGFMPLYGSRAKFYGIMDYFYESAYTNNFTPGLQNVYLGISGNPTSKLNCSATYHYLAVATELSGLNRTLGHSIEVQASYQFTKDISLTAAYTQMMGTETMDRLKQGEGSKRARWGWFSLVISPSLFTTKW